MNTQNSTAQSPEWAEDSTWTSDDEDAVVHKSATFSADPGISYYVERMDSLVDGEFKPGGYSICLEARGNGRYNEVVQIDLDEPVMGDTAAAARRIATQLIGAADRLDGIRSAAA